MSGARFLDDLARTLAEPMPRRRALRLLGTSLAAVVIPGAGPRIARAAPARRSSGDLCGPDRKQCTADIPTGNELFTSFCCKPPHDRWDCPNPGDKVTVCRDTCAGKDVTPCSGKADASGRTEFSCCAGRYGEICRDGKCVTCADLEPGATPCILPSGKLGGCCSRGTYCFANPKGHACCGGEQIAKTVKGRPTCVCRSGAGAKCGSDCCKRDKSETCCKGKECCTPGETCTDDGCCPKGRALCSSGKKTRCCAEGEYCLWKEEVEGGITLGALGGVCKKTCSPALRCGPAKQCCGTGYRCRNGKCVSTSA